jgi:site-specific DNA-methyltransferase (adenine-specific)
VDQNPQAIEVMDKRLSPQASVVRFGTVPAPAS